ncbi:hypothetical protein AB0I52_22925 [Streptomyces sp. NPDC050423]|uniref:hypothetical protein n=1 Tax=Streptomyces sp. NPDC050423 TaxID=3155402 RepID=UPI00341C9EFC
MPSILPPTTDIDARKQLPVVVAQPLTDALLGCLRVVLPDRRELLPKASAGQIMT